MNILERYTTAFSDFMKTGNHAALGEFCEPDARTSFFAVYRNGYLRTTIEALAANFPVVDTMVGTAYFKQLAHAFVSEFPPTTSTLTRYGKDFPAFIGRRIKHDLPYLADVASLDFAWLRSYFSSSGNKIDTAELASFEDRIVEVRLALHSSVQLVSLTWNVFEIWQLHRRGESADEKISFSEVPQYVLVWRPEQIVQARLLNDAEFAFFTAIKQGETLGVAADAAIGIEGTFDLGREFSLMLEAQLLSLPSVRSETR